MPSSPCADAPAVVVPASATWMPPEPPAPPTDLPPLDTTPYGTVRDSHGRFLKGNPGGTGNPNARRSAALKKALCEAMTAEEMYKVGRVMLEKALKGDVQAAKFLASYVIGQPTAAPDADRLDLEELKIYTDEAAASAGVNAALNGMAAGMSCFFISSVRPAKMHQFLGTMGEALRTGVVPDSMAQASDPDQACPDRSPEPPAPDGTVANRANGGSVQPTGPAAPAQPAAAPSQTEAIGPDAAPPPPRPQRRRARSASMPGWPTPEQLEELRRRSGRSPNRDNGGSAPQQPPPQE